MSMKPTEPGMKFDADKLRYDLVHELAEQELVAVLTFGAIKYDANNWKSVPDAKERYYASLMRHVKAHRMGEVFDPESGLLTMGHALCNAMFVTAFDAERERGSFKDRYAEAMRRAHAFRGENPKQ